MSNRTRTLTLWILLAGTTAVLVGGCTLSKNDDKKGSIYKSDDAAGQSSNQGGQANQ
jgi:hypothetical protein